MRLRDAAADKEAEPETGRFAAGKRFREGIDQRLIHRGTIIRDRDEERRRGFKRRAQRDHFFILLRHRFRRVFEEVMKEGTLWVGGIGGLQYYVPEENAFRTI